MKKVVRKKIAILGSTGSIGINALKVIEQMPERFEVTALTAFNNAVVLAEQVRRFRPKYVAALDQHLATLKKSAAGRGRIFLSADAEGLSRVAALAEIDIVVIALTGAAALDPFLAAAQAGKTIAPANKEALVMAGDILMSMVRRSGGRVIPVDSEQSAIFQCLAGENPARVRALHLTASGGALRGVPSCRHDQLSVEEILAHPRWKMGRKITVDSASLMNKGFEVIEAMRLFAMSAGKVHVLVHPEAVVHSLVEFVDGSWLAQLGLTDMRIPIQYALTFPERVDSGMPRLDLAAMGRLTFEAPDLKNFPALDLAFSAARRGGTWPAVLNAADEVAVEAFLAKKIRFTDIFRLVDRVFLVHKGVDHPDLKDIREADSWARIKTTEYLKGIL